MIDKEFWVCTGMEFWVCTGKEFWVCTGIEFWVCTGTEFWVCTGTEFWVCTGIEFWVCTGTEFWVCTGTDIFVFAEGWISMLVIGRVQGDLSKSLTRGTFSPSVYPLIAQHIMTQFIRLHTHNQHHYKFLSWLKKVNPNAIIQRSGLNWWKVKTDSLMNNQPTLIFTLTFQLNTTLCRSTELYSY